VEEDSASQTATCAIKEGDGRAEKDMGEIREH